MTCGCLPTVTTSLNLLIVGLDFAGKTTLVSSLQQQQRVGETHPTIGFSKPIFMRHKRQRLKLYDVGGGRSIRAIWGQYLPEVHGIIYVVDAANRKRISEAGEELSEMLLDKCAQNKHILVLANKQDEPGALPPDVVDAELPLHALPYSLVKVVACSARMKEGNGDPDARILQGLDWLISSIRSDFRSVTHRVRAEHAHYLAQEEKKRRHRLERGKQQREKRSAPAIHAVAPLEIIRHHGTDSGVPHLSTSIPPLDIASCKLGERGGGDARVSEVPTTNVKLEYKRSSASLSSGSLLGGTSCITSNCDPCPVCEEIEIAARRSFSDSDAASETNTCGGSSFFQGTNLSPVLEAHVRNQMHAVTGYRMQKLSGVGDSTGSVAPSLAKLSCAASGGHRHGTARCGMAGLCHSRTISVGYTCHSRSTSAGSVADSTVDNSTTELVTRSGIENTGDFAFW